MRVAGVLLASALCALPAHAQVSCADPDNLCTGDPCVIPSIEVVPDCTVDFRPRQLVIAGTLQVPADSLLSLTAATIRVEGRLFHSDSFSTAHAFLAAEGDIDVQGGILMHGSGDLTLDAGGSIDVAAAVTGSAGPGTRFVTLEADGAITIGRTLRNEGPIAVRGATGVTVSKPIIALLGYSIEVSSSGGTVLLDDRLIANGPTGGDVTIAAQGDVTINRNVLARGRRFGGGSVSVTSAAGSIIVNADLSVRGLGGTVDVTAPGSVTLGDRLDLFRAGTLVVQGGSVTATAGSSARADTNGCAGALRFEATAGDLTLSGRYSARARESLSPPCGIIEGAASGDVVADGTFLVAPFGCIAFSAGGTVDTSGGTFDTPVAADCPD
jgi:hypothetical protein